MCVQICIYIYMCIYIYIYTCTYAYIHTYIKCHCNNYNLSYYPRSAGDVEVPEAVRDQHPDADACICTCM